MLMTGYAAVDSAVEAIKLGAREYLTKPFDFDRLRQVLVDIRDELDAAPDRRAREPGRAAARILRHARPQPGDAGGLQPDPASGAAREGRADHRRDRHRQGAGGARVSSGRPAARPSPSSPINCSAVVDTLFESELFGHVRGAFTGAVESEAGRVRGGAGRHAVPRRRSASCRSASRRSCCARSRTARCSASGRCSRSTVDVTVIAATNRDLRAEVAAGRFRGDLFYRLERRRRDAAAAARSARGHPVPDRGVHARLLAAPAEAADRPDAGRRAAAARTRGGTATSAS